jgi:hypothetical protein
MIQHDILENVRRNARCGKRLGEVLTHLERLRGMFQDHRIACHQRRGNGVDRGHVGVVPWCNHHHHAMRNALDLSLERVAVLDFDRCQRAFGNARHVAHAFVEAAILAAITHRPAHLVRQLRCHPLGLLADDLVGAQHPVNALLDGPRRPRRLLRPRPRSRRERIVPAQHFAFDINRSINRRNELYCLAHAVVQALSKPRAISQSVTTASNASCSTSAARV